MKLPDRFLPTKYIARQVAVLTREKGLKIATIESCTAGMLSTTFAAIPGGRMHIGLVTYNDTAKKAAGIPHHALEHPDGPYTHNIARAMVNTLQSKFGDENFVAISTTGVLNNPDRTHPHVRRGKVFVGLSSKSGQTISYELSIRVGRRQNMQRRVVRETMLLTRNYLQELPT